MPLFVLQRVCAYSVTSVGFWYASSKNIERDEWVRVKVMRTNKHCMEAKRVKNRAELRSLPIKSAYEHVHLAIHSALTQEVMSCTLHQELGLLAEKGKKSLTNMKNTIC